MRQGDDRGLEQQGVRVGVKRYLAYWSTWFETSNGRGRRGGGLRRGENGYSQTSFSALVGVAEGRGTTSTADAWTRCGFGESVC